MWSKFILDFAARVFGFYNHTNHTGVTASYDAPTGQIRLAVPVVNAYTTTSAAFTQPAVNGTVSVSVGSTNWMSVGLAVYVVGGGYYTVSSRTSATVVVLTNTGNAANAAVGTSVATAANVGPGNKGTVNFAQVADYSAMLALGAPPVLTVVKVKTDTNRGLTHSIYSLWPDGIRQFISSTLVTNITNFSSTGTVIDDGGGPFGGNQNNNAAKAFDGDVTTYYDAVDGAANKYTGRDFGSALTLNQVEIYARQDVNQATKLNGAEFQYSTNGTTWTTIQIVSGVTTANYQTAVVYPFTAVTARYFRLYWSASNSFGNVSDIKLLFVN